MKLSSYTLLIVAGIFAALFAFERFFPLRRNRAALATRLVINLALSALAFLTAMLAVRPSALQTLNWASHTTFGLLNLVRLPGWAQFAIGFLLLDASFYYWHIINHRLPVLWRFHNVHHMDPDLDISTGFRFHFGEVLLSALFRIAQVSLIGMSFATFAVYELVFQANTLFQHSNARLPIGLERMLNLVLVTPRMHAIHHSQVRGETDSNFGVVFSWWDKLHRTVGLNIPQSKIEIGVPGYSAPGDNRLRQALMLPFRKQRDYWRKPDGTIPTRDAAVLDSRRTRLAE
ncbi:MAG: sterol desaturase family protein [Verrucomicrobia bacterium]|nr:sterol desaturase family protein [Verrucomicrobiota bacterium]MDE3100090.1 sterol desaturase family protein [Verrucomicrobiota bacterium]